MVDSVQPHPTAGERIPDLVLPDLQGQPVRLSDLHGRWNDWLEAVIFTGEDEAVFQTLLADLQRQEDDYTAESVRVVLIAPAGSRAAAALLTAHPGLPFVALFDEHGAAHRQVQALDAAGRPVLAAFVTDRYGNIEADIRPGSSNWPPSSQGLLDWLRFISIQCPE
jgi:peroxiredoxin